MNIQTIVKSLRGGQTNTADQLRQTLDQINIEGLEAAAEKLEAERRRVLLDGSDKELEAIETKIAAANRDIERAYAAKAELEKRLEAAIAAATEAELSDRYNAAKAKADAAAKLLRKEYPDLGQRLVELIRVVAEADVAIEEANKRLPEDAAALWPVEVTVRRRPGSEEKTLSEKEVQLWCHAGSWEILPDNRQGEAEKRAKELGAEGRLPSDGIIHIHGGIRAVERRFIRRTYLPRTSPIHYSPLASVVLPGLVAGDPPIWEHRNNSTDMPRLVLARMSDLAIMRPMPPDADQEPVTQLIAVADTPAKAKEEPATIDMAEEP
ncbi:MULTISPECIES: hypothetical protein [Mesorhizobium]|uniref:Uncharacterized protein n=4 Tax=Mesorhizobium TaxID=68287 RepID=A0AB38T5R4_9HYPH|nr:MULTISPECIES: hypothetical protein [Mesorhizobium]MDF3216280.1 hypothetical protein [Mesorhizobium ciceri]RUY62991.1 hypothetical protein EN965_23950 [Mesorhizobium sp. M7A.F.Ca.CA.001.05.1.1]RUY65230.1 hypothetical protein EN980_23325 [Mesorhizobium sp. M7A.F.Ca.CA.001.13.1.1]RUZ09558.1 hypothetical protein EN955_04075 [Mesorhizobium sp. M7A.F.Ca.CA.001.04.2.1]RUZ23459.1 hypothetical protein EN961_08675 [Mesorhizobium sp. M7A.F.Ca.CA.001.09.1.1]